MTVKRNLRTLVMPIEYLGSTEGAKTSPIWLERHVRNAPDQYRLHEGHQPRTRPSVGKRRWLSQPVTNLQLLPSTCATTMTTLRRRQLEDKPILDGTSPPRLKNCMRSNMLYSQRNLCSDNDVARITAIDVVKKLRTSMGAHSEKNIILVPSDQSMDRCANRPSKRQTECHSESDIFYD